MERKILIAVDGSIHSAHSLHYIGNLLRGGQDLRLDLLTVVPAGGSGGAARDWLSEAELLNVLSPAVRKTMEAQHAYLESARASLEKFGILPEQIGCFVKLGRQAVADEILHQARHGQYDALLIGRRGIGKIGELLMGSVSASILEKCHDLPLWIVDGQVSSCKFLVPVDGTCHSLRAVDHFAFIAAQTSCSTVTLFYSRALLTGRQKIEVEPFHAIWGKEWCDTHLTRPDSLFHAPRQILLDHGFPEDRIFSVEDGIGIEPGREIIRYALQHGFGTIVMGRRGGEIDKGIFRGVSDRVLLVAKELAIWVVG